MKFNKKVKLTKLESLIVNECYSDHATDGFGLGGYVILKNLGDPKELRGAVSSLIKKGVIDWDESCCPSDSDADAWVSTGYYRCVKVKEENGYATHEFLPNWEEGLEGWEIAMGKATNYVFHNLEFDFETEVK